MAKITDISSITVNGSNDTITIMPGSYGSYASCIVCTSASVKFDGTSSICLCQICRDHLINMIIREKQIKHI